MWKRAFLFGVLGIVICAAAGAALYSFAPSLFFDFIDPRGPTVRQVLGTLAATVATAVFTKQVVQHESRVASEKAEINRKNAEDAALVALQNDAAAVVRAYVGVQEYYDPLGAPVTLKEKVSRKIRRQHDTTMGIDRSNWATLLSTAASDGIFAQIQFLSKVISPRNVQPISEYLYWRADFASSLTEANAAGELQELYTALFSDIGTLPTIESLTLLDARLKSGTLLLSLLRLLQATRVLGLSVERFDEVEGQAQFASDRIDAYFEPDAAENAVSDVTA